MFNVTYRLSNSTRRKAYKTEVGALRAIWKWLVKNKSNHFKLAILYSPSLEPREFTDDSQLPFEQKQANDADFYSTQQWKELRYRAFKQYQNKCACCGATPETGAVLHVDHIKPRSKYPELALCLDNLQILCEICNIGKLNHDQTKWRT
ncbi:HNH endonuclease [Psychrobium sp. 1_MG-2023]|uniref:HNH endonuclease n=1 Tax=Psychrobium sp. 1_MG-2023 TaxID=3062624 RepID=UPI0026BDC6B9|nr:HNH endonuclease [Psychrobium sp. 1_MG-2023]MDP2562764.1 HNH endonuclease [Psychrobium sp. 1_MG-2023]